MRASLTAGARGRGEKSGKRRGRAGWGGADRKGGSRASGDGSTRLAMSRGGDDLCSLFSIFVKLELAAVSP